MRGAKRRLFRCPACGHARRLGGHARGRARAGFSLLELMVVAAIIALLLAILLPSIDAARRQTRRTVCAANLSQLAKSWQMLLNDKNGLFPRGTSIEFTYGGKQGDGASQYGANPRNPISKPLNRYVRLPLVTRDKAETFLCPEDTGTFEARPTAHAYYGTSYKTNPLLIGQGSIKQRGDDPCLADVTKPLKDRIQVVSRSQVANESRLILIGDLGWDYMWDYANKELVNWHQRKGFYNLAFLDGHVFFTRIRKGINVDGQYTVIPFKDLQSASITCQAEVPDE
jgi:prepilin-type N-terminal cleavage/methylation domain-containing protein/prepilin-type processing-associated H-X9-DG protein